MDLIVRGREVELSWEASLRDSTTYVFQFGKGIADVNEGNPAVQLVHAFSTGPELDTLSLKGLPPPTSDRKAAQRNTSRRPSPFRSQSAEKRVAVPN